MTPEDACRTLTKLRSRLVSVMKQISRKRAWTPAEKACAMGDYQREIDAIDMALLTLNWPTLKTLKTAADINIKPDPKLMVDGGDGVA